MTHKTDKQTTLFKTAAINLGMPFASLATLSLVSNLLMLTGPLFMMQVYDRVLASHAIPTLVTLTILVGVLFALYGVIEAVRSRLTLRIGNLIDERVRGRLFRTSVRARLGQLTTADPLRDGEALRNFTSSAAALSFLDLPWTPIYVGIVFVIHPTLGWLAVAGIIIVSLLLIANEFLSKKPSLEVYSSLGVRQRRTDDALRNAEAVIAMGMLPALQARWETATADLRNRQDVASDLSSVVATASKSFRFFLQSAVLAVGAYLVIEGEMSGGSMIAASVITARALAPVDQVVGAWRSFIGARQAWGRIRRFFEIPDLEVRGLRLPLPKRSCSVQGVTVGAPGSRNVLLSGLNFELASGDGMGVIGPSGAGKTTLARLLVGAWAPFAGELRWDGASMSQFDVEQIGLIVGYLPQKVELFDGTIAENISRFRDNVTSQEVIDAATLAGAHELIISLADGYDTAIGEDGSLLSAGQRQRIGLARAVFGNPFLVVLDEPNSNLDGEGEEALNETIMRLRANGSVVVVIAHRPSAINALGHILVLNGGRQVSFGEKNDILDAQSRVVSIRKAALA